ncbi:MULTISPECIES: PTS fructose transporter subunit IIB [Terrabacteria group]|uniref:PTS fructose transporter subunit IIB n=1 Tax=Bacillati TaxID=1783272 RepID=UPI00193A8F18|nr:MULTISPECIES: fructose PTS transporter subunit IIB [Terrabacteria group]MBW9212631.1 fructose PTS transporter subunit IIB [Trueperella sp. zg.1013]QRG86876.1 PTS fructose transporter subunit IIBC [Bulleidia sp. zg-1006]
MYVIGISACPTGIAHTYMAADAIEKAAQNLGAEFKVETQGSIGIENKLTIDDINRADIVIITAAVAVREFERFQNYQHKIFVVSLQNVIAKGNELIKNEMMKRGILK